MLARNCFQTRKGLPARGMAVWLDFLLFWPISTTGVLQTGCCSFCLPSSTSKMKEEHTSLFSSDCRRTVVSLRVKYLGVLAFFSQQMKIPSFKASSCARSTLIFLTINLSGADLSKRRATKKLFSSLLPTVLLSTNKKTSDHTVGLEAEIVCFTASNLPNYCWIFSQERWVFL